MELLEGRGEAPGDSARVDNAPVSIPAQPTRPAPNWQAAALAWTAPCLASAVVLGVTARPTFEWIELQAFNSMQHAAFAFLTYLCIKLGHRGGITSRARATVTLIVLGNLLGWAVLPDDVWNFSERHSATLPPWLTQAVLITLMASSIGLAWLVSVTLAARASWRLASAGAAIAAVCVNHVVLPGDYRGVHLMLCLVAVAALTPALAYGPWARWLRAASAYLTRRSSCRTALGVLGGLLTLGLVAVAPSGRVQTTLLRSQSAPVYGLLARLRGEATSISLERGGEWFVPRPDGYLAAPNGPAFFDAPIVLLLTVDALRADVVSGRYDAELPTFARLRAESVFFDNARAPGTLTKVSVTSVFTGKYFSQQFWTKQADGKLGVQSDSTLRFPEYLRASAIRTVNVTAIGWIRNGRGVVKGFAEEIRVKDKRKYTPAPPVVDAILERLEKVRTGPFFLHTHFSDPHEPYDLATRTGTPFERYLAEVALVDEQLARLLDALESRDLAEHTIVIVQADHGEAFGEHGSQTHGTTLYDEVLRVPLMFKIPGVGARRIDTPVTTMDLGPTILETFGLPVPASFMGQSLIAVLKGANPRLTRPIAAENRLQQALVLPNRLKIIHDLRSKTNELYDLSKDPGETHDLSGNSELLREPLATLQAFFEAHRYRAGGYQPPFIR